MNIEFPGPPFPTEDGGILYRAKVNGEAMACHFTWKALEDVAPQFTDAQAIDQFKASRCRLLEIAETKIRAGHVRNVSFTSPNGMYRARDKSQPSRS